MVNATQGLSLTLRALGAGEGGLCAMPAWTFVASAHAVTEAGLTPWFLDVDPETSMLDPERRSFAARPAPLRPSSWLLRSVKCQTSTPGWRSRRRRASLS
jgi:hypothetical protein